MNKEILKFVSVGQILVKTAQCAPRKLSLQREELTGNNDLCSQNTNLRQPLIHKCCGRRWNDQTVPWHPTRILDTVLSFSVFLTSRWGSTERADNTESLRTGQSLDKETPVLPRQLGSFWWCTEERTAMYIDTNLHPVSYSIEGGGALWSKAGVMRGYCIVKLSFCPISFGVSSYSSCRRHII